MFVGVVNYVILANLKYSLLSELPSSINDWGRYGGCNDIDTLLKGGLETWKFIIMGYTGNLSLNHPCEYGLQTVIYLSCYMATDVLYLIKSNLIRFIL